jgi:putative transposase
MDWARLLAYITGTVDQELLLRNEYLTPENRILKAEIKTRLQLSDAERATLAEIGIESSDRTVQRFHARNPVSV